jgi:hypothetical protein
MPPASSMNSEQPFPPPIAGGIGGGQEVGAWQGWQNQQN